MITTCSQLLSLPSFQKIHLLAGESGLYRTISWPFVTVTPSVSDWLHGGELVFVTCSYYQTSENDMILFLQEALKAKLAGVIVLQGGESHLAITPAIIEYANQHQFPLFSMEWDIPIVDVVREISEMIIFQKKQFDTKQRFFFEMLFSSESEDKYDRLTTLYELPKYRLSEIALLHPADSIELTDLLEKLSFFLQNRYGESGKMLIAEKHINNVVCLLLADDQAALTAFENRLSDFVLRYVPEYYAPHAVQLTFSESAPAEKTVSRLYDQACKALKISCGIFQDQDILYWKDVGYRGLFFDLSEEKRRHFVSGTLKALADAPGSMDLVNTLRCYLDQNCNIVHTAQMMFLHKNTLNYRLNRIRELLGKNPNDPDTRINLRMALDIMLIFPEEHYFS